MSTATVDRPVVDLIGDEVMPVAELMKKASPLAIAKAWAAGLIEFGRRKYCTSGPEGKEGSRLIIEGPEIEWSGPKVTNVNGPFADVLKWTVPVCELYVRLDMPRISLKDKETQAEYTDLGRTTRAEAEKLLALQVKLTDKGMQAVTA